MRDQFVTDRVRDYLKTSPETKEIVIGQGVVEQLPGLIERHYAKRHVRIVADENTFEAAGRAVYDYLSGLGMCSDGPMLFPGRPHLSPDFQNVLAIQEWLATTDAVPVSVGSGTLNDLTKLAAFRLGRPFLTIATAASMDGYASSGAPIVKDGYKKTLNAAAARVIVADTEVLVQAPKELTAAGYADLLGKVTSGADWILADELGIDPILQLGWDMVQPYLQGWTGKPEDVARGEPAAFAGLLEGLTLAGMAMQVTNSTRPASGAEHQIGHLWEMSGVTYAGEHMLHGFTVALGSIVVAGLYDFFLRQHLGRPNVEAVVSTWPTAEQLEKQVRAVIGPYLPMIVERAVQESLDKHVDVRGLRRRLGLLATRAHDLRARLERQLLSPTELRRRFEITGCPTAPKEYGFSRDDMRQACILARLTRNRYTILDILAETGLLEPGVDFVFANGYVWNDDDWRQE